MFATVSARDYTPAAVRPIAMTPLPKLTEIWDDTAPGPFYVRYRDRKASPCMSRDAAVDVALLFGGTINLHASASGLRKFWNIFNGNYEVGG
jgi:hypothetical protein